MNEFVFVAMKYIVIYYYKAKTLYIPTMIIKTYVCFLALVSLVSNLMKFSSKKILSAMQNA